MHKPVPKVPVLLLEIRLDTEADEVCLWVVMARGALKVFEGQGFALHHTNSMEVQEPHRVKCIASLHRSLLLKEVKRRIKFIHLLDREVSGYQAHRVRVLFDHISNVRSKRPVVINLFILEYLVKLPKLGNVECTIDSYLLLNVS